MALGSQASATSDDGNAVKTVELSTGTIAANTKPASYTTVMTLSASASALLVFIARGAANPNPGTQLTLIDLRADSTDFVTDLLYRVPDAPSQGETCLLINKGFASGTVLKARFQSSASSVTVAATLGIHIVAIQGDWTATSWDTITTLGPVGGTSNYGVRITPGTNPNNPGGSGIANTYTDWVPIGSPLADKADALILAMGCESASSDERMFVGIGTGSGSVTEVIPELIQGTDGFNALHVYVPFIYVPIAIPSGTQLNVRMRANSSVTEVLPTALYAVKFAPTPTGSLNSIILPN